MQSIEPDLNFSPSGRVEPRHLGLILAEGPDVATFLQGQLTHDVLLLPEGQARLAGYCSAKGRLMSSFIVLKVSTEQFILICHRDLLQSTLKRLSMFVMRAKVKLVDASSQFEIRGLLGHAVENAFAQVQTFPAWSVLKNLNAYVIKLHDAKTSHTSCHRALWIAPQGDPSLHVLETSTPTLLTEEDWLLAEVLSGISMVQTATAEAFVPQMLNYESVDGVSFKKGCYPGQEVVARSQFRGTLKRRAYVVSCASALQVGQEVYSSEDAAQACGTVASAAPLRGITSKVDPDPNLQTGAWWGIVSMQTSAAEHSIHLQQFDGPALKVWALPYPLLEDI